MWIEALVIGIFLGVFRGGKFSNLDKTSIKGSVLIVLAIFAQLAPIVLKKVELVNHYASYVSLAGLVLIIVVIFLNIRKSGMWLVLLGSALNSLVFYVHGYKMPINLSGVSTATLAEMKLSITSGVINNYMLFADTTHWSRFLGKIFILPNYYPFTRFIGFPDILVALGLIWVIQSEFQNRPASYGGGYSSYYSRY